MRVVVVGAGVVGAWLAKSIAERGAETLLADAGAARRGATYASFAWLNASTKDDPEYFALNVMGMQAWHDADRADPGIGGYWRCGAYEWADNEAGAALIAERVTRLRGWGYDARPAGAAEIAEHHRGIQIADLVGSAGGYPGEAIVDPDRAIDDAIAGLRDAGGQLQDQTAIGAVLTRGGAAVGVQTVNGDRITADAVVLAAGTGNVGLCRPLGVDAGLEAATAAGLPGATLRASIWGGASVASVLRTPGINLRPTGVAELILHADDVDRSGLDERGTAAAIGELTRRAEARLGGRLIAGQLRASSRVMPRDGRSIIGWADGVANLYLVMTHSGVTLAPALSTSAGLELTEGVEDPQLAPFRPNRFATAVLSGQPVSVEG
jgi:glycine/D-amino acid oxidase-like deaminating enzyme